MTALSPGASPPPVEIATRIVSSGSGILLVTPPAAPPVPDQTRDLSRLGMAAQRLLGEDQLLVRPDLEHAARGRNEANVASRKGLPQLGRQPGGPGLVVSGDAVLDRHVHRRSPPRGVAANRSGPGDRNQEARRRCDGTS